MNRNIPNSVQRSCSICGQRAVFNMTMSKEFAEVHVKKSFESADLCRSCAIENLVCDKIPRDLAERRIYSCKADYSILGNPVSL